MMGQVNKERLAEFLGELQRKQDTNDRYVAALKGETLTRKPYVRIQPMSKQTGDDSTKENNSLITLFAQFRHSLGAKIWRE